MIPKSDFFLGVDGGGTKTEAVLIDNDKKVISRASAKGSNANIFGIDSALKQVVDAIQKTLANQKPDILYGYLAIAGINTKDDQIKWQQTVNKNSYLSKIFSRPPLIINDTIAALRSATTDQNAVVIIAGTGSNCYGRNAQNQEAKSSGLDWILSDEGSAYAIGLDILHCITKSIDGRSKSTKLKDLLFEKHDLTSLESLNKLVYEKPWNKTDIASIAPLAQIAAEQKDEIAISILKKAAFDLTQMVKAVAEKLDLISKHYSIVYTGSVFSVQKILFEEFKNQILKFSPNVKLIKPRLDSATGAAYLALESFTNL